MRATTRLRQLLTAPEMLIAPGAYDGLTARLTEQAGFAAVYMTGAGTAAGFGLPDFGLLTMTEMVANAARMTAATSLPMIADGDTGYGNELNVVRLVREHERAGTAGIHIEDQTFPKRCGHLDGKELIPIEAFVAKIRAAVASRSDPDFLIIARSDARSVAGLDEAVARVNAALDAGADIAFVESPTTLDEVAAIPRLVRGACLLNVVWRGRTPPVDLRAAQQMGYRIAILPGVLTKTIMGAVDATLAELKASHQHPRPLFDADVQDAFRRVGADEWNALRERFRAAVADEAALATAENPQFRLGSAGAAGGD